MDDLTVLMRQIERSETMSREEIMEYVASYFGIEPDEDGEFDISGYDWQAGCYINRDQWMSLAEVVRCIESFI